MHFHLILATNILFKIVSIRLTRQVGLSGVHMWPQETYKMELVVHISLENLFSPVGCRHVCLAYVKLCHVRLFDSWLMHLHFSFYISSFQGKARSRLSKVNKNLKFKIKKLHKVLGEK